MAHHIYKHGKWYDKDSGEEVIPVSKATTWTPGGRMMISVDSTDYRSPIDGTPITSKRQHAEALKRAGCRVLEPGESRMAMERRESDKAESARKIAEHAAASIARTFEF